MIRNASLARLTAAAVGLFALSACSNLDDTQQKMLSGGAIGATVGTVTIAATGGCIPCGTAIGGIVGAGAGYVLDQMDKGTKSGPSDDNPPPPRSYNSSSNYNPGNGAPTY